MAWVVACIVAFRATADTAVSAAVFASVSRAPDVACSRNEMLFATPASVRACSLELEQPSFRVVEEHDVPIAENSGDLHVFPEQE